MISEVLIAAAAFAMSITAICLTVRSHRTTTRTELIVHLGVVEREIFELENEICRTRDDRELTLLETRIDAAIVLRDYLREELDRLTKEKKS